MYAHIARQPIYDYNKKVCAYELLYRSGADGNTARILDADAATRSVLNDAINVFGLEQLTDKKPAYINFTRNLLMDDTALLAGPKEIVVQVPPDVMVDDLLVQKLNGLRRAGYRIALDGYTEQNGLLKFDRIIQTFDIIAVDFRDGNRLQQKSIVNRLRSSRAMLMAERVETMDDFASARAMGFLLFQGYFFQKPVYMSKPRPPLSTSPQGRLLNELLRVNPGFESISKIIQSDAMLRHMFLVRAQESNFRGSGETISEVRRGLVMMGTEELRRWIGLILLKENNVTHSDELARQAYCRGLFIERLMENADTSLDPRQGFLLGLFSLLYRVMGVSMESLLSDLNVLPPLRAALLGEEENEYSLFLQYAVIYEMANPRLILPDLRLRIEYVDVEELYVRCIADTDAAFARTGGNTE